MMQKMSVVKAGDTGIERREKYVTFGLNVHSLLWKGEEREVPREEREKIERKRKCKEIKDRKAIGNSSDKMYQIDFYSELAS